MAETTVTNADVETLAGKLESMSDQFSPQEQATLHALFGLAAMGVDAASDDVAGFAAVDMFLPQFAMTVPGTNGILIGLNKSFGGGGGAGKIGGLKLDMLGHKD